jgi:hypothetical protein
MIVMLVWEGSESEWKDVLVVGPAVVPFEHLLHEYRF